MSADPNSKAEDYRRKHGSLLANQQEIRQLIEQIPLARQKLLDKVDAEIWYKYMDMKKSFNDPLARVEKGTCMGCRVGITFNELRLLKQGEGLVFCSNCGRMLYWERQG
jgi:predicted  nucleic acid-binding Zn-ribbon protein